MNFAQKRWIIFVIARDHLRAQFVRETDPKKQLEIAEQVQTRDLKARFNL